MACVQGEIEAMKALVASSMRRRHIWSICYQLKRYSSAAIVQVLDDVLLTLQETNDLVWGSLARSRGVDTWRIIRLARYQWAGS
jgi:hypothetical protein